MATLLYRLGYSAYQRRRVVIAVWILVLAALGGLAGVFSRSADAPLTIPGVESVEAISVLQDQFPRSGAGGATARIVFAAPAGAKVTDPENKAAIEESVKTAGRAEGVAAVTDPFLTKTISADGTIAYATAAYQVQTPDITEQARTQLLESGKAAEEAGLQVEFGGDATAAVNEMSATEALGVVIALIVLAITFGSLLAAGLPLITALFSVGVGMAGVLALSSVVDLTSTAPVLGLMLGLAVGIDYALFITVRHKENLADGLDPHEAAARSVATAGSAVIFAGATVMVALAGLAVVGIPFLTTMGLVAAGMVGVAVLVSLTLVPAFLGVAGARFSRWPVPGLRKRQAALTTKTPAGARWATSITKRPLPFLLVAIIGTGILAVPAADMELGLPSDANLSTETTQRRAYDLLAKGFGPGFNGPLTVVVDGRQAAAGTNLQQTADSLGQKIGALSDVAAVTPATVNQDKTVAVVAAIPKSSPSSTETKDLVSQIRDLRPAIASTGATVLVTGYTAVGVDLSEKLADALPIFLIVVVGLSLILLTIAFRSILVPLKATVGFLLSVGATFGSLVAVFQWGWLAEWLGVNQAGPILNFLPILLVGLLFGLAMDYEVFLVSRMREDFVHGAEPKAAVVGGFRHGARVVTAAALIMASVFAGFILGGDPTIKSIGFALAFGVLIDAFVIRMTVVPALMALLGRSAWWIPRSLDRALPKVDIEGAKLKTITSTQPEPVHQPVA
ncbi:MMPL family transporter [Kribbella sp. NPDC051587]|uniref:MMPL family transporter n=1 Tax=Kribbella sp. NPDC051587 TaxID=3364119 RepID=UPI0037900261